jgi:hypothetical protein
MKQTSTLFLKLVIVVVSLAVVALCIFGLPVLTRETARFVGMSYIRYPLLIDLYITAVIFFFALYNAFKILTYIDKNSVFTDSAVKALRNIKYSGVGMTLFYAVCMPIVFTVAQIDDAPGLVVIGMVMTSAPFVVSVFAGVLEKMIRKAIEIKSENDLTV